VPFSQRQLADCLLGRGEETASAPASTTLKPALPRVLVVDDNEVNRRVACGYLRKLGFSCDIAEDGQQALEAVKENSYGLVFMDCQMPVMDGFDATSAIRRLAAEYNGVPIVALTANALAGDREKCLGAGMDDYITKPIVPAELEGILIKYLDQQHKLRKSA
ncbi:MAG: response regulator, partial [Pseudomonadota bacterium]